MSGIMKLKGEETWIVPSERVPGKFYKVTLHDCDCKAFQYGGGKICKHMNTLIGFLGDQTNVSPEVRREDAEKLKDDLTLVQVLKASIKATAKDKVKLTPEEEFNP